MTLAKRITHVETPHGVNLPSANVTGPEWGTVWGEVIRLQTLLFDERRYASTQAALNAARDAGGGIVRVRGSKAYTAGLTLYDGVYLHLDGQATLDFSGMTSPANASAIYGGGSLADLPALAAAIPKDGRTVTFAAAPALAPGDWFILYSSVDYSWSPGNSYYRKGEFCRVLSVSGTTVTLSRGTYDSYPLDGTITAKKVTPIRTGITGGRIVCKPGSQGVKIELGTMLRIENLDLIGTGESLLWLSKCVDVAVRDVRALDWTSPIVGRNYGLTIGNCQHVAVADCTFDTGRHGLNTGGDSSWGAVTNRDIRVANSYLGGRGSAGGIAGCSLHDNIEHAKFTNCTMPAGFNPGGDHITLDNCDVFSGSDGFIVYGTPSFPNHTFQNCRFWATAPHTISYAFLYINFNTNTTQRGNGTMRFVNNEFHLGPYGGASTLTYGVAVVISAATFPTTNVFEFRDNIVESTATPTDNGMYALSLTTSSGGTWREVHATGNRGPLGLRVNNIGPKLLDLSDNTITDARYAGIEVVWPTTPVHTNSHIIVRKTTVLRARDCGLVIGGNRADTRITLENVTALDCAQSGVGTSARRSSMYITNAAKVTRRDCEIGDTQATPTQLRLETTDNVGEFIDHDTETNGALSAIRTNVTTLRYRGRGAGAPTLVCADGSTYLRTDGTATTTFYVRAGGAWVAK